MNKIKAGLKTSEFWLALIAAIVPVLNQHLGLNLPIEAMMSIAGIAIAYIFGRSIVKKGGVPPAPPAAMMVILILSALMFTVPVFALEMPDLSVDGYLLYNFSTKQTTAAPGISAGIVKFADGIIEGNVGVVFPAQNDATTNSYAAGPIIDINLVTLIKKIKGAEIVAKDLKLSAGIGVLVDVFHMSGRSLKETIFSALHIRFVF